MTLKFISLIQPSLHIFIWLLKSAFVSPIVISRSTAPKLSSWLYATIPVHGNFILPVAQTNNPQVILLLLLTTSNLPENHIGSTFKTYPELNLFSPSPLLPPWSKPLKSLSQIILILFQLLFPFLILNPFPKSIFTTAARGILSNMLDHVTHLLLSLWLKCKVPIWVVRLLSDKTSSLLSHQFHSNHIGLIAVLQTDLTNSLLRALALLGLLPKMLLLQGPLCGWLSHLFQAFAQLSPVKCNQTNLLKIATRNTSSCTPDALNTIYLNNFLCLLLFFILPRQTTRPIKTERSLFCLLMYPKT